MKQRTIDTIKITVTPRRGGLTALYGATVKDGVEYIHHVYINGESIWSDGISISTFEDMLRKPGDYWPFFCSYCGEPGCVDIFYPIRCFHKDDLLILVIREPLRDTCFDCGKYGNCGIEETEGACDCPKRQARYRAYCIKKEKLRQQIANLRKEFGESLDIAVPR